LKSTVLLALRCRKIREAGSVTVKRYLLVHVGAN